MLAMFLPIFAADAKITSAYNFVAPSRIQQAILEKKTKQGG